MADITQKHIKSLQNIHPMAGERERKKVASGIITDMNIFSDLSPATIQVYYTLYLSLFPQIHKPQMPQNLGLPFKQSCGCVGGEKRRWGMTDF